MVSYDQKRLKNLNRRWILGVILGVVIVIIGILVGIFGGFNTRIGKVPVNVAFAPFQAEVTFNGEKVKNDATNYLSPGEYQVEVTLKEFETYLEKWTIKGEENVFGTLKPTSEKGVELAKKYQADYLKVESLGSTEAFNAGESEAETFPLLLELPINLATYSISYRYVEDGHPQIVVKAGPTYFQAAISKLKEIVKETSGKTLAEYDIVVEGVENPFLAPVELSDYNNTANFVLDSYPNVNFTLSEWQESDDYYYATMSIGAEATYDLVVYRVVLSWDGERLKFAALPEPLLTVYNAPGVPVKVLNQANS